MRAGGNGHNDIRVAGVYPADLRWLAERVQSERRVLDAEAEFDAVLQAGGPVLMLRASDRRWAQAAAARDALISADPR